MMRTLYNSNLRLRVLGVSHIYAAQTKKENYGGGGGGVSTRMRVHGRHISIMTAHKYSHSVPAIYFVQINGCRDTSKNK